MKKLSAFRQLSLNCDSPPQTPPRRPQLRKQFSEDISEYKTWSDRDLSIKISLNSRNLRNPFIKNAWIHENAQDTYKEEPVIIRKCSENRRIPPNSLLAKQNSVERELVSEKFKPSPKPQPQEKPNIKIFLAQPTQEETPPKDERFPEQPKLIQPLVNNDNNSFKLRKNAKPKPRPVPNVTELTTEVPSANIEDVKPIDSVIIRPATAASKREMFQKRTNSAFNATVNLKDAPKPRRPLVRSSSAPCKQTKHKPFKKVQLKVAKNEEFDQPDDIGPKSQKELNRSAVVQGNDVVTMISLISPSGSDCEEEEEEDEPVDDKIKHKVGNNVDKGIEKVATPPKIMSLRKAVKTVSFQQSSIHAIRSFSASFPARRASVTAAMMLSNNLNNASKMHEKRSTNSCSPDDDERVPKRRLVRTDTEDAKTSSLNQENLVGAEISDGQNLINCNTKLAVGLNDNATEQPSKNGDNFTLVVDNNGAAGNATEDSKDNNSMESKPDPDLKSQKEKQCWSMYCKMSEKGINISFDTILRGMLTPTEYRISKKHLMANQTTESTENPK